MVGLSDITAPKETQSTDQCPVIRSPGVTPSDHYDLGKRRYRRLNAYPRKRIHDVWRGAVI